MREHQSFPPAPTSSPMPANDDVRVARRMAVLEELTELGLDMAWMVHGATQAAIAYSPSGSPPQVADLGRVFKQLAQCVRRTTALEARLAEGPLFRRASGSPALTEGVKDLDAPVLDAPVLDARVLGGVDLDDRPPSRSPVPLARHDLSPLSLRQDELRAVLAPAIEADRPERDELLDALERELDRLADRDDFLSRPFGELVLRISFDLDLDPDWTLWMDADWVVDAVEAAMAVLTAKPVREPPPPRPAADVILLAGRTRDPP